MQSDDIFDQGYSAYFDGQPRSDNPHKGEDRKEWDRGWVRAEESDIFVTNVRAERIRARLLHGARA